ncbi:MAG: transglycosylase SLT domain-containing protein [Muribaculaceae bacterium]|nr:transglycosylase SLT domain-containing protein [Muribaculaceae bacterium]
MALRFFSTICLSIAAVTASAAMSILDIKHSITDPNVIAPESFETATRQLEEDFYLKYFTERVEMIDTTASAAGTPQQYAELLSRLPTEMEMPYNEIVGRFIDMYLTRRRTLVADMIALHNYYGNIFVEELTKQNMPLELQYLPVIESAIQPNAVSRAGAVGLWQFMPATAGGLGLEINSLVDQRRDPRKSSAAAAKYLRQLHDIYDDWSLAIAAYNCGPGNVNKALRRAGGGKKDFWEIYNFLPTETRGYLPAFIAANFVMNYYDRFGLKPTVVKQQLVTDTVQVADRVHFNQIAQVLNIPVEEIRMLNPQFRKDIIPGNNHPYSLVLPSQQCLSYIISHDAIMATDADQYARRTYVEPGVPRDSVTSAGDGPTLVRITHTVKRGENLRDIARRYGVSATDIKKWNNLKRGKVKAGQDLTIEVMRRDEAPADTTAVATRSLAAAPDSARTAAAAAAPARQVAAAAEPKATPQPKKKTAPAKPAGPTRYKVRSGDNLSKIAKRHGVTVKAIQQANNMGSSVAIRAGQTITIPAKTTSSSRKRRKK